MPRKTSDKEERILRAAIKVFARKGFYNARVSEIAREAFASGSGTGGRGGTSAGGSVPSVRPGGE